ncbi:hypothetical protein PHET_01010 [Paragonimus heterotremus]|uniref:Uncharacterized protein n=1 Tax=Paragonimus heterotremus TaxID=100268 RepID=A0A8J4X399_9TREM|nr:hypothetical protein PHET_01010 [Paragonimus heterotremus]
MRNHFAQLSLTLLIHQQVGIILRCYRLTKKLTTE